MYHYCWLCSRVFHLCLCRLVLPPSGREENHKLELNHSHDAIFEETADLCVRYDCAEFPNRPGKELVMLTNVLRCQQVILKVFSPSQNSLAPLTHYLQLVMLHSAPHCGSFTPTLLGKPAVAWRGCLVDLGNLHLCSMAVIVLLSFIFIFSRAKMTFKL